MGFGLKKGSKLYSILKLKCPHCHEGELFSEKGLLRFKKILEMPEKCSVCGQKYEIEPGFWLGALWTSYPIVVAIELPFLLTSILVYNINPIYVILMMTSIFFLLWSVMLRLGRSIWINLSIHYDKNFANHLEK